MDSPAKVRKKPAKDKSWFKIVIRHREGRNTKPIGLESDNLVGDRFSFDRNDDLDRLFDIDESN